MTDVFTTKYAHDIYMNRYSMDGQETWRDTAIRCVTNVCGQHLSVEQCNNLIEYIYQRKFIPAGRYLYGAGRQYHMIKNCYAFRAEDTREGWGTLLNDVAITSMSGGGCGTDYSDLRPQGTQIKRTGGVSSGPLALMHAVNESCRYIKQGGSRRAALLASLNWGHGDILDFLHTKDISEQMRIIKDANFDVPVPLEFTNISVNYDTDFFVAMENKDHPSHKMAKRVWKENCMQAFKTGEPGFCFNFLKDAESLRNPCGEYVTHTNRGSCNLGTVFMNYFDDRDDFERCLSLVTLFLMCGNLYSDYPTEEFKNVAMEFNEIGVGLGGVHEWLIRRDSPYTATPELHKWLNIYERQTDESAYLGAKDLAVSVPRTKRAIAPTGTIGGLAETTTGIELLFCKAYKRKYYENDKLKYQYVVDGTIKRLMDDGIDISNIQDAHSVSFRDRVKVQADIQQYVDMAISSTCNMTEWGSEENNESNFNSKSKILLKYAKRLRGFTCYPDGSRTGQPLERVELDEALKNEGQVFEFEEENCTGGVCGV